jgi:tripartite-type tricarboxylate transporter receptor subunit TctC
MDITKRSANPTLFDNKPLGGNVQKLVTWGFATTRFAQSNAFRASGLGLLAILWTSSLPAFCLEFPNRVVKVVVAYPPGGLIDIYARAVTNELGKVWQQPVIVENRPGSATNLGAEYVAKSAPNGYTILLADDGQLSRNKYLFARLSYDPEKDFIPVVSLASVNQILIANRSFPARTLEEFIALAKATPGSINYGSFGIGSKSHVDTEVMSQIFGIKLNHVAYKGIADVIPAFERGEIQIALAGISAVVTKINNGTLQALAVATDSRQTVLPNVPTFEEAAGKKFVSRGFFGLAVPTGTPTSIVERISSDTHQAVTDSEFERKYVTSVGFDPMVLPARKFQKLLSQERATAADEIPKLGIKLE